MDRERAREVLAERVESYRAIAERAHHVDGYPEEQVRIDYIDPLLECLGWDLRNAARLPHSMREVLVEPTLHHDDEAGRPDYTLRPGGVTRVFVEAKRPAIDIATAQQPARQVRRPGQPPHARDGPSLGRGVLPRAGTTREGRGPDDDPECRRAV